MQQLFEDAKLAGILCLGGPVMYAAKEGITGITNQWLFEHVVPNIRRRFWNNNRLCRILCLLLIYICLAHNEEVFVPGELRNAAYAELGLDEGRPIKKPPSIYTE